MSKDHLDKLKIVLFMSFQLTDTGGEKDLCANLAEISSTYGRACVLPRRGPLLPSNSIIFTRLWLRFSFSLFYAQGFLSYLHYSVIGRKGPHPPHNAPTYHQIPGCMRYEICGR